ncbi:hypothetical protein SDJN03_22172, partial [Cucurbita argyrosperma subsp. sororia]
MENPLSNAISPLFPSILLTVPSPFRRAVLPEAPQRGSRRRSIIGRREQRGVGGGIGKDSFIWQNHSLKFKNLYSGLESRKFEISISSSELKLWMMLRGLWDSDGGTRNACIDDSAASSTGNNVV